MRRFLFISVFLIVVTGTVGACSTHDVNPPQSATNDDIRTSGISTPTIPYEKDAYNEALIAGELGVLVENGKAYFIITDEQGVIVGLVFPPGHYASSDGKVLKWAGNGKDADIAEVGDHVEFSGGETRGKDAAAWDASTIPSGGLWLAVTDIPG
ncbi:hypothetical protein [Timonella sp. A28]|uniref:hypothetical protein n=1 Tax=Timonella sp. A28 TaxID=3442640 RepID=UPI003EBE8871